MDLLCGRIFLLLSFISIVRFTNSQTTGYRYYNDRKGAGPFVGIAAGEDSPDACAAACRDICGCHGFNYEMTSPGVCRGLPFAPSVQPPPQTLMPLAHGNPQISYAQTYVHGIQDCFNPNAPRSLNVVGSQLYWIEPTPMMYDEALHNCKLNGGWLADIYSVDEREELINLLASCYPLVSTAQNNYAAFWLAMRRNADTQTLVEWIPDPSDESNSIRDVESDNWYSGDYPNGEDFINYNCGVMAYRLASADVLSTPPVDYQGRYWMEYCTKELPSICMKGNPGAQVAGGCENTLQELLALQQG